MPWMSSLTGQTARELAAAWTADSGKQWVQTLGYSHALFETGIAALKNSGDPKNPDAVRDAIATLNLNTMVGPVNWAGSPIKNVAVTQVAGGQWRKTDGGVYMYDLVVNDNSFAPSVDVQDRLIPLSQLG